MTDDKSLLESYANDDTSPEVGHAWYLAKVKQEVAKSFLEQGNYNLIAYYQEVLDQWETTKIYLEAMALVKSGMSLEQALSKMTNKT